MHHNHCGEVKQSADGSLICARSEILIANWQKIWNCARHRLRPHRVLWLATVLSAAPCRQSVSAILPCLASICLVIGAVPVSTQQA